MRSKKINQDQQKLNTTTANDVHLSTVILHFIWKQHFCSGDAHLLGYNDSFFFYWSVCALVCFSGHIKINCNAISVLWTGSYKLKIFINKISNLGLFFVLCNPIFTLFSPHLGDFTFSQKLYIYCIRAEYQFRFDFH